MAEPRYVIKRIKGPRTGRWYYAVWDRKGETWMNTDRKRRPMEVLAERLNKEWS